MGGAAPPPAAEALAIYRRKLFTQGRESGIGPDGRVMRVGFDQEEIQQVEQAGGKLRSGELIRHRVRHFVDGAILGSREFVNTTFASLAAKLCPRRKNPKAARRIRGKAAGEAIYSARNLSK